MTGAAALSGRQPGFGWQTSRLAPASALLALLALLLALLLAPLLAAFSRRATVFGGGPSSSPSPLRRVGVADVQLARLQAGGSPWLVTGLPPAPDVAWWRTRWRVERVRALASPTGVFAAYGKCTVFRPLRDMSTLHFPSEACAADEKCAPVHSESELSPEESAALFSRGAMPAHFYVRGQCSAAFVGELRRRMRWPDLQRLSPYLSGAGAVTNLHWDGADGILAQTSGSKLVSLFAPGTMPAGAPASSPCARRSYEAGAACPGGAALTVRLEPGFGVYIPANWAHHVTSLSPRTLGAVWRFAPPPP